MSNDTTQAWLRQAATARPSARRIRQVTDRDIVTRYVPRLAGRNVHLSEDPMWYDTRAEAVEAARRVRNRIAAEAKMSNDTTQHTPADVRERVAKIVREAMEDARRSERLNTFLQSSMWDYADRILALLRTPRGEGEALAVEVIRLNTALALLKTEENAAHVEAVATNAAWLEELERIAAFATRTPALRLDAALRSEAEGQGGIHPDPETWRCRQCGGYAAHYRDCPALRSEAQGEEDAVRRTWEQAIQRAYGCLDYCGGYRGAELKAFHSGIKTVIRALEAGLDTVDTQTAALDRIGAARRGEGGGE